MDYIYIILLFLTSYLIGSIQSGLIIGKVFKNIDIREHGSKSTGSTNAIRVLGFKYGIWAFFFDTLKGALVIIILKWVAYEPVFMINDSVNFVSIYGLFAVLGHVFSIFNHFKGGKAVATSLGAIIAIEPLIAVIVLTTFAIVFFAKRYVSLASSFAALSALISFIVRIFLPLSYTNTQSKLFDLFIFLMLGLIIALRHRSNYQRLKAGTENKM